MSIKLLHLQILFNRIKLDRANQWSRPRLLEHQTRCTRDLRLAAYQRSPFYQKFHRGLEDRPLAELPILTKTAMMENFDDLMTDRAVRLADVEAFLADDKGTGLFHSRYVALSTSGSTGKRGLFLFDPGEWVQVLASISRTMSWARVVPSPFRRKWKRAMWPQPRPGITRPAWGKR